MCCKWPDTAGSCGESDCQRKSADTTIPETCPWLVQVPSGCPEPDSPSDLYVVVECGAPLHDNPPNGQRCENGHEFGNLETRFAPYGPEWGDEIREAYEQGYRPW